MAKSKSSKPATKPAPKPAPKPAKKTPEELVLEEANALAPQEAQARRSSGAHYLSWIQTIATQAKEDAAQLLRVSMAPDADLKEDEIASLTIIAALLTKQYDLLAAQNVALAVENERAKTLASGRTAQREVLAALQHLYRNDPEAKKVLAHIRRGKGEADFLQDVPQIEALVEQRKDAYARLTTDAPNARKEMLDAAAALATPADAEATKQQTAARALRDRLLALAERRVTRICSAGRYCFRNDPAKRKAYRTFRSTRKAKAKRAKKTAP